MTPASTATTRDTWVRATRLDRAVLARPLNELHLPFRVQRACDALGLRTIADVLGTREATFLAVPGVGTRSWRTLLVAVRRALQRLGGEDDPGAADPSLAGSFADPRTQVALVRLGCPGRDTLYRCGEDVALCLPGMQATEYQTLVVAGAPPLPPAPPASLWPAEFTRRPIHDLGLLPALGNALAAAGVVTFGDLLRDDVAAMLARDDVGAEGVAQVREALARLLHARAPVHAGRHTRDGGLRRLLHALDTEDRAFVVAHAGLSGRPPASRARLASLLGVAPVDLGEREARCRTAAHARCHGLLARWRRAAASELVAQDGAVRGERLAAGALKQIARTTGDAAAPLRLLAFLFPQELFFVGDVLTVVGADVCKRVAHAVRALRPSLPKPLAAVESDLAASGLPKIARGLLLHLLQHDGHVQVLIDAQLGEMLHRRRTTGGDRIEHVLRDARHALSIQDLLFRYRDRYGRAQRARLLDHLWAEPRFLEIGPGTWDLRERHVDQAELIEAEAARLRDTVCTVGGRHDVADLVEGGATSERVLYLLRDRLRRDPALRSLGRGSFCARAMRSSSQMEELLRALRAAGGELPLERFLGNQNRASRNLRTRLLRENRLFIEVAPDRIDALTNYPLPADRLRSLLHAVEMHLEQRDGFDRATNVHAMLREAGLAGTFLSEHMLRDLLVRHGRFELLADDLVALRTRGLKSWIQQRAREAIRRAGGGLTTFEIQTEIPELSQFASCLERVIGADPMVQSPDGLRYVVV